MKNEKSKKVNKKKAVANRGPRLIQGHLRDEREYLNEMKSINKHITANYCRNSVLITREQLESIAKLIKIDKDVTAIIYGVSIEDDKIVSCGYGCLYNPKKESVKK
ncbi:MAG: hypothetical protein IMZ53_04120 [Thermoplasmata archaeon]|nr:hypothetical protein [Thermoplasmata archaeon]MBE3139753.1 hypothetical protein [Thermoplasmata archaeon]